LKSRFLFVVLTLACCVFLLNVSTGDAREVGPQILIGGTSLDDGNISFPDYDELDDLATNTELDLTDMFSIGGALYHPLGGKDKLTFGIEYGGILSYASDDVDGKTPDANIDVSMEADLLLLDLFVGPQVNFWLGEKLRLYGGLGGVLMVGYGSLDFQQEDLEDLYDRDFDNSDTKVGGGGYVRLGAELKVGENGGLGLGVRGFAAELDLDNTLGELDFQGVQGFITYTTKW